MQNIKRLILMHYVLKNYFIKYTRICRTYSGRKLRAASFVYLQGSPYRDAEGSTQIRSCLHDAIIDAAPRIGGGGVDKLE